VPERSKAKARRLARLADTTHRDANGAVPTAVRDVDGAKGGRYGGKEAGPPKDKAAATTAKRLGSRARDEGPERSKAKGKRLARLPDTTHRDANGAIPTAVRDADGAKGGRYGGKEAGPPKGKAAATTAKQY